MIFQNKNIFKINSFNFMSHILKICIIVLKKQLGFLQNKNEINLMIRIRKNIKRIVIFWNTIKMNNFCLTFLITIFSN